MSAPRHDREAGLSILEVAVAGAVLMIALASAFGFFTSALRRTADLQLQNELQAEVRLMLDRLVPELRQAYTGDPALSPVASIAATSIMFYSPDRATPLRLREISYRLSGSVLERAVRISTNTEEPPWSFAGTRTFIEVAREVVTGTLFQGRDATGAPTSSPAAIRQVGLDIAVDADPARPPTPQRYQTSVEIRVTT